MILLHLLTASALFIPSGRAQIFPFSNLRAFFDPKTNQGRQNKTSSPGTVDVSRPYRQADKDHHAISPTLQDFSSPDIFTINRDFGDNSYRTLQPGNTYFTSTEATRGTTKRRNSSRYRIRPDHHPEIEIIKTQEEDFARPNQIFITPRPPPIDQSHYESEDSISFPNVATKQRTRPTTPQYSAYPVPVEPIELESEEDEVNSQFSENHSISVKNAEVTLPPNQQNSVENLAFGISGEDKQSGEDSGLIDYLVPPSLPSVFEKRRKRPKLRSPAAHSSRSKVKHPPPSPFLKKDNRFRSNKKHRSEVKHKAPLADRATTTKRHIPHRRPTYRSRDIPPRRPLTVEKKPKKKLQLDLQKQASQIDEQITAETGFSGASSSHHPHPNPSLGNERVEFQMHGQKGPHSYKFGYDTGKGHNRQFRFEEKDNHGHVRGHYGYYDKEGKLQVVNYEADPHSGFKAESL